ncbi:MAG: VanW family protein [bacterium]
MNNSEQSEITEFDFEKVPATGDFLSIGSLLHLIVKYAGVFAFAALLTAASLVSYDYISNRSVFPPHTFIGKLEVGGLSQDEAIAKLKETPITKAFTLLITLESDNQQFTFAPDELGIFALAEESAKKAYKLAHKENYLDDIKQRMEIKQLTAPLVLDIDTDQLRNVFNGLASKVASTPKDASIIFYEETGGYHIESEGLGRELLTEQSIDQFKTDLYQGKRNIQLAIDYESPRVTEKELRANPPVHRLSAYTTYYGQHDDPNRIHNIKLIASWLDDLLLMPGDAFSLIDLIGEFTPERGFKEALVIYGGELVPQFGGGTCQIGTTLYNTVALADLHVSQRRNHSFYFNIYPLGRDASVYPPYLDLKFENDTGYPLLIKTIATNKRLSFRLYGTPTDKKVEFSSVKVFGKTGSGKEDYAPMSLKQVIDKDIPFRTETLRTVKDKSGQIIKEENVISHYKLYGEKDNVPIRLPGAE